MTITFFSNFLNHHQLPLCLEFINHKNVENFHFVSCERIYAEKVRVGYEDMNVKYPFVIRAYESEDNMTFAKKLARDSDVAIIGSALPCFAEIRAKENKLTFLFCERIFKNGTWHRFNPLTAFKIYKGYIRYKKKNFYILCASAYAANDFELCGFPKSKCLKWGYFPECKKQGNRERRNSKLKLMWCGRMIWWKYPEHAVEVAKMLKERNIDFELQIIGNGDKETSIKSLIIKYDLTQYITLHNFMSPEDIRINMEQSDIYIFSSGREEGWGVVLSEAMNSGCVVIANNNAGSTPSLIEDSKSGFVYNGSIKSLEVAVEKILQSDMPKISLNAYNTITQDWNHTTAANNLIYCVGNMVENIILKGPCSLT